MSKQQRYPEEFKIAAVRQITEDGYTVSEVARSLDVTVDSLYAWVRKYSPDTAEHQAKTAEHAELQRLLKALKRVTEELVISITHAEFLCLSRQLL